MIAAPFNRKTIEDALADWIAGAIGVSVLWTGQDAPAPALPYVTLAMLVIADVGSADGEQRIDGEPPAPQPGAEVAIGYCGHKRITLSVNVYASPLDVNADARAYMDKARASLALATYADALRAAGIALVSIGAAQSLDELQNAGFVSRAQCDFMFSIASNLEERVPYIATIGVVAEAELGAPFTLQATE